MSFSWKEAKTLRTKSTSNGHCKQVWHEVSKAFPIQFSTPAKSKPAENPLNKKKHLLNQLPRKMGQCYPNKGWPIKRLRVYRLKGTAPLGNPWTIQKYHQWSPCVILWYDYGPNIYQFQLLSINPNVIHQLDLITIKDWPFRAQLVTKSFFNTNHPPVTQKRPCWKSSTCLLK